MEAQAQTPRAANARIRPLPEIPEEIPRSEAYGHLLHPPGRPYSPSGEIIVKERKRKETESKQDNTQHETDAESATRMEEGGVRVRKDLPDRQNINANEPHPLQAPKQAENDISAAIKSESRREKNELETAR